VRKRSIVVSGEGVVAHETSRVHGASRHRWGLFVAVRAIMLHTWGMTMPDLPERPGQPSDTRQMVERGRTESGADVSGRVFVIALVVVAIVIAAIAWFVR
jgi:hypothetical protein